MMRIFIEIKWNLDAYVGRTEFHMISLYMLLKETWPLTVAR